MPDILIGVHAGLGELAVLASLWFFVELLNPTETRIRRAKFASVLIVVFIFASWLAGGYYYVNVYTPDVKPVVKAGPAPWAHGIFTETKEHVFMFLPFLSVLLLMLIFRYEKLMLNDKNARYAALLLALIIFLFGLSIAGMGYIISSGVRAGLEAGVL